MHPYINSIYQNGGMFNLKIEVIHSRIIKSLKRNS